MSPDAVDDLGRHRLAGELRALDAASPVTPEVAERRQLLGKRAFQAWYDHARAGTDAVVAELGALLPALARWDVRSHGTTMRDWLFARLDTKDEADRRAARAGLRLIGDAGPPGAAEVLWAGLCARSPLIVRTTLELLAHLGPDAAGPAVLTRLTELLLEGRPEIVLTLLNTLTALGAAAARADVVDALVALREELAARAGGWLLPESGPERLPSDRHQGAARLPTGLEPAITACLRTLVAANPALLLLRQIERLRGRNARYAVQTLMELRPAVPSGTAWEPLRRHLLEQRARLPDWGVIALPLARDLGSCAASPELLDWIVCRLQADDERRDDLLAAVIAIGPAAADPNRAGPAANALLGLLASWLGSESPRLRNVALQVLPSLGRHAGRSPLVIDRLFDLLRRRTDSGYWNLLRVLGDAVPLTSTGRESHPLAALLQHLVGLLRGSAPVQGCFVIEELARYEGLAAIRSVLVPLVEHLDGPLAEHAAEGLHRLGPLVRESDRAAYLSALAAAVRRGGERARELAAAAAWAALRALPPPGADAPWDGEQRQAAADLLDALRGLLGESSPSLRSAGCQAWMRLAPTVFARRAEPFGPRACQTVIEATLLALGADDPSKPFEDGLRLLVEVGEPLAVPKVLEAVAERVRRLPRIFVLNAVARLGPLALQAEALPAAAAMVLDVGDEDLRCAALEAVAAWRLIERRAQGLLWERVWVRVLGLTRDPADRVRRAAALLLGQSRTRDTRERAAARLAELLEDRDHFTAEAAAETLASLGVGDDCPALPPVLGRLLGHDQPSRRLLGLMALSALPPRGLTPGLATRLVALLEDPFDELRSRAAAACRAYADAGWRFFPDGEAGWALLPAPGPPAAATG